MEFEWSEKLLRLVLRDPLLLLLLLFVVVPPMLMAVSVMMVLMLMMPLLCHFSTFVFSVCNYH